MKNNIKIMAKGSILILKDKIDVNKLIEQLNMALSEEWLAYYQYWIGSFLIKGNQRAAIQKELMEHAQEELKHAEMLANRIIELEGNPVSDPARWFDMAKCKYYDPKDENIAVVLRQNIEGERCAIVRYKYIIDMTHGIDYTTCEMAKHILREEEEHEQEMQDFLDDINEMHKCMMKQMTTNDVNM